MHINRLFFLQTLVPSNHEVLNEFRYKIGDVVNVSVEDFSYYALQGKLN